MPEASPGMTLSKVPLTTWTLSPSAVARALARSAVHPDDGLPVRRDGLVRRIRRVGRHPQRALPDLISAGTCAAAAAFLAPLAAGVLVALRSRRRCRRRHDHGHAREDRNGTSKWSSSRTCMGHLPVKRGNVASMARTASPSGGGFDRPRRRGDDLRARLRTSGSSRSCSTRSQAARQSLVRSGARTRARAATTRRPTRTRAASPAHRYRVPLNPRA